MIKVLTALSIVAVQLVLPTGAVGAPAAGSRAFTAALRAEEGSLELRYQDRRVLLYAFAEGQFKPYVRELYTLAGDNVLLDAPADHLHHHGLMYAIKVNGVNFWEEQDQPGHQKSVRMLPPQIGKSASGLPQASFTHLIHWVSHENAARADTGSVALLLERRTLTVTIDEARQETALNWHSDFEAGPAAPAVTLTGASYHGLGLRLPAPFNRVALHQNSEKAPYPSGGSGDVTPARWSSVSSKMEGRDVTVALFGRPAPERGMPIFFTMVQPFTYLSVTQGLDQAPLEYKAAERFSLEYLLGVYSERKSPEFLEKRHQLWVR